MHSKLPDEPGSKKSLGVNRNSLIVITTLILSNIQYLLSPYALRLTLHVLFSLVFHESPPRTRLLILYPFTHSLICSFTLLFSTSTCLFPYHHIIVSPSFSLFSFISLIIYNKYTAKRNNAKQIYAEGKLTDFLPSIFFHNFAPNLLILDSVNLILPNNSAIFLIRNLAFGIVRLIPSIVILCLGFFISLIPLISLSADRIF